MCHPRYALLIVLIVAASLGLTRLAACWFPEFGRLPGDLVWRVPGVHLHLPLVSSALSALVLIPIVWALRRR